MKRREFDVKFMWLDQGFNVGWEHSQLGQLPRGQNTEIKLTELADDDRVVSAEQWSVIKEALEEHRFFTSEMSGMEFENNEVIEALDIMQDVEKGDG